MFNDKKDCVRTWYLGVALLQLFWFCPNSLADGKVYSSVAYKASPQIPSQSALIRFKEGVETLVVQSTFDGPGQGFAWLLPVPSLPTELDSVSPGFLKTLDTVIGPTLEARKIFPYSSMIVLLGFVLVWVFRVLLGRPRRRQNLAVLRKNRNEGKKHLSNEVIRWNLVH